MAIRSKRYTCSPWSGERYTQPPTVDELTVESKAVPQRNPATARVMSSAAMGRFLEAYRAKAAKTAR
jgi:hypothetical protein